MLVVESFSVGIVAAIVIECLSSFRLFYSFRVVLPTTVLFRQAAAFHATWFRPERLLMLLVLFLPLAELSDFVW